MPRVPGSGAGRCSGCAGACRGRYWGVVAAVEAPFEFFEVAVHADVALEVVGIDCFRLVLHGAGDEAVQRVAPDMGMRSTRPWPSLSIAPSPKQLRQRGFGPHRQAGALSGEDLLQQIRTVLKASSFLGDGHRKVKARLAAKGNRKRQRDRDAGAAGSGVNP